MGRVEAVSEVRDSSELVRVGSYAKGVVMDAAGGGSAVREKPIKRGDEAVGVELRSRVR